MWRMTWPLLLIIFSNVLYNLCTKSIPENTDAFGTLIITYIAGIFAAFTLFFMHSKNFNAFSNFNWPSVILGLAIVGLEAGYVYLYRAGWQISKGSLMANTCLAIILIFTGALIYGEKISFRQIIGVIVCIIGLYLINTK